MKIPSFCTLVKKPNDLLTKIHTEGVQVKAKSKSDTGLTVETKGTQQQKAGQGAVFSSNAKLTFQKNSVKLVEDLISAGTLTASAIYEGVKNLKAKGKLQVLQDKSLDGYLACRYKTDSLTTKFAVTKQQLAKFCFTTGRDGFGIGFQMAFSLSDQKLTQANQSVFWLQKHSKLVFRHLSTELALGEFSMHYYQKLSPSTKLAYSVLYPWKQNPTVCFGGEYKWHKNTKLNAVVSSKGNVTAALKQDINPHLNLTVSADVDVLKVLGKAQDNAKLGFVVSFQ